MTPRFPATAVRLQPLPALLNASREARLGHSSRPHLGLTTLPPSSPSPSCQLPTPRPKTCQSPKTAHNQTASTLDSKKPSPQPDLGPLHSGASPRLAAHRDLSPPPRHTHDFQVLCVCWCTHTPCTWRLRARLLFPIHRGGHGAGEKGGKRTPATDFFFCFALLCCGGGGPSNKQQPAVKRRIENGASVGRPACLPAAGPANA